MTTPRKGISRSRSKKTGLTLLQKTEAALRESEQRFTAIFDKSPVGIALVKMPETVTVSVNNAFLGMLEYTGEEVIGKTIAGLGIQDPATRAKIEAELDERGAVHNFEFTRTTKNGANLILSLNLDWVNIGEDKHIITTIRNITERRRIEEALLATRQMLQTVVDRIPAAVSLIRGSDLRLQLVNPAYQAIAPGKEMIGHTLDEIWNEAGQDFAAICRHVLETGEPYRRVDELNVIQRVPDGPLEQAYFSWSLDRVQLPGDQGWGLLNTSFETTSRKQAEDELQKAYEEMEQRVRERTSELVKLNEELKAEISERERAEKKAQELYAAELKSRREAEAISAMSLELTRTLDVDTFLRTVLKFLPSLIPYGGAWIVIVENETHLRLRAVDGFDCENSKRTIGSLIKIEENPCLQEVLSKRRSLLIQDTRHYPGWEPLVARKEIRNWLGVPILLRGEVMGIVGIVNPEPGIFTREDLRISEVMAAQVSVAIQNAWLFEQVQAGQERFQMLSRRLVETQENERRYIARELQDETSQEVTGILLLLRNIEQEAGNPERVLANVTEVKQLTDDVLESMHRLAMNLRPASLDHVGLIPALEQLVKDFAQHYRVNINFKSESGLEAKRLSDYIETILYRIVQEALTNSVRHARAENIDVILESRDGKILVVVEDDGIGFDTNEIQESHKLGLVGMQERAKMMGGELQIESRPEGGTTIVVSVNNVTTAL